MTTHPNQQTTLEHALERARLLELKARKLVHEQMSGGSRSVFRGRGMDFDEVREYVAGDDVRAIDWNVTARAGRPFVKKFREEHELTLVLAIDISASGDFGSGEQTKRELAAELAAVLALVALQNRDRVGLLLFSDRIERFVPPESGRGHVLRLINEIMTHAPEGVGTDLSLALEHLQRVVPRRALVLLISDLLLPPRQDEARLEQVLACSAHKHELMTLWLQDPRELALPQVGALTLEDAETGEVVWLDTRRDAVRAQFAALSASRREVQRMRLMSAGARVLELTVGLPYAPALKAFLAGAQYRRTA